MSRAALVVMAAGIGSRFGRGIKQLEPVGPNGEIIMEYSIYDAMEAGFANSARTAHPFQRNGAPFRFKLSKAQQVN